MPTILSSPATSSAPEVIHIARAPGEPGLPARWTSAHKDGVGASAGTESDVWFTISHGILNEIYFPRQDQANTRDFGFVVTADDGFFSEEKRDTRHTVRPLEEGVPGYVLTNTCREGRYRIHKVVIADPFTDSVLTAVRFEPLQGALEHYRLYALLAPHLENHGGDNEGWCGDYHGEPMLFARRGRTVLALACTGPWLERTCGFVGESDGWQQLHRCGRLDGLFDEAGPGNIALTGRVDLADCGGEFVCAVAFGHSPSEAGLSARLGLARGFTESCDAYVAGWRAFQKTCRRLASGRRESFNLYRVSTSVLHLHESRRFPGGVIASLAIPWGNSKGDEDMGAYHFVWPRDQWHAATGLLAAGLRENARSVLLAQMCTQSADGSWPQNMWLDGHPFREAIQHDQLGGFLLLAELLRSENWLGGIDCWSAMRRTACYLIEAGPVTQQDR